MLKQRDKLARFDIRCGDVLCQSRNTGAMGSHLCKCVNVVTGGRNIKRCITVLAIVDKPPAQKAAIQRVTKTQAGVMLQVVGGRRPARTF